MTKRSWISGALAAVWVLASVGAFYARSEFATRATPADAQHQDGAYAVRDQMAEPSITTTWPFGSTTNSLATPHRVKEPAGDWLDRHFASTDAARKRQE